MSVYYQTLIFFHVNNKESKPCNVVYPVQEDVIERISNSVYGKG